MKKKKKRIKILILNKNKMNKLEWEYLLRYFIIIKNDKSNKIYL